MGLRMYQRGLVSDAKAYLRGLAVLEQARDSFTLLPVTKGL